MAEPKTTTGQKRVDVALGQLHDSDAPNQALHPPVDELTRRRAVDAVMTKLVAPATKPQGQPVVRAVIGAAMIVFGVVVGVVFSRGSGAAGSQGVQQGRGARGPAVDAVVRQIPQSRFALLHGEVRSNDASVELGERVPTGQWIETGDGEATFALPTGIGVALASQTSCLVTWGGARRFEVKLGAGMALFSVNPNKERDGFVVSTPKGKVVVKGTLFTVRVEENGAVLVNLHKGRVKLVPAQGKAATIDAGQWAVIEKERVALGGDVTSVGAGQGTDLVVTQLRKVGCMDEGRIFSELENSGCKGEPAKAKRLPTQKMAVVRHKPRQTVPSAAQLLDLARVARRAGRYADSARALETLIDHYGGGNDARTALVSLGRLELNQLGAPHKAIAHFSRYLQQVGPLTPEALLGKAQAARALGKPGVERTTLEQLLRQAPDGPAGDVARRRLDQMKRKK